MFLKDLTERNEIDILNDKSLTDSDKKYLKTLLRTNSEVARKELNIAKASLRKNDRTLRKDDRSKYVSQSQRKANLAAKNAPSENSKKEVVGIKNHMKRNIRWQTTKKFIKNVPTYVGTSPGATTAGKITSVAGTFSNG